MADNVSISAGTGTSVATDDIAGVQHQRVKVEFGADGSATDVSDAAPLPTKQYAGTAALSNVSSSASSVTVLAANVNRRGACVFNDSTQVLYLKFGATASSSSHTVQIAAGGYYEVPFGYVGILDGIWASANGAARVTELT